MILSLPALLPGFPGRQHLTSSRDFTYAQAHHDVFFFFFALPYGVYVESSDYPHETNSPIKDRPKLHTNSARKYELGDVTPRPVLHGFTSSEKALLPLLPLPFHHSVPSVLPTATASIQPCVLGPSETTAIVAPAAPALALASTVPSPRIHTSPASRAFP